MAVVVLLANGILQQIVQPIAYGATLGLHPLAVLIVTIAAGSLFGTVGLVLAAPLPRPPCGSRATSPARARRSRAVLPAPLQNQNQGSPARAKQPRLTRASSCFARPGS